MASSISSVNYYDLEKLFPKNKISKDTKFHYLILGDKTEEAIAWLNDNHNAAICCEKKYLLTPLHLCAIKGNAKMATILIEGYQASVAAQDIHGWTPLHHAALRGEEEMLNILILADKVRGSTALALKNINEGTYEDLRQLAFPKVRAGADNLELQKSIVFRYRNDERQIVDGTAGQFENIMGAKFASQMHGSPEFFIEEWINPTKITDADKDLSLLVKAKYASYLEKSPLIYVDKTEAGWGVFAEENIQEGCVLVDYLGEATHSGEKSLYAVPLSNGEKIRNLGPILNDGFPNCVDMPLCNIKGFPIIRVLLTIRSIEKGEQLLWNYGHYHPVKMEKHSNLAGEKALKWLQEQPIIKRYEELGQWVNGPGKADPHFSLHFRTRITPFHYLLCTPSFQILLLLQKITKIDDLFTLSKQTFFAQRNDSTNRSDNLFSAESLDRTFKLVTFLFKFCQDMDKPANGEQRIVLIMNQLLSKISVACIFGFFETLKENLKDKDSKTFVYNLLKKAIAGNLSQSRQQGKKLLEMATDYAKNFKE